MDANRGHDRSLSRTGEHRGLGSALARATVSLVKPPNFAVVSALHQSLTARRAAEVAAFLSPAIRVVVNSGEGPHPEVRVLEGIPDALALLMHATRPAVGRRIDVRSVNGQAGLITLRGGVAEATVCIDFTAGRISAVWVRLRPDYRRHGNTV